MCEKMLDMADDEENVRKIVFFCLDYLQCEDRDLWVTLHILLVITVAYVIANLQSVHEKNVL